MNRLTGRITSIDVTPSVCRVTVVVGADRFDALIIQSDDSHTYHIDQGIDLAFKPTDVILSQSNAPSPTITNAHAATIRSITHGEILSKVELSYQQQTVYGIVDTNALQLMSIQPNETVQWLIPANHIMLIEGADDA